MVVEGEEVRAFIRPVSENRAECWAEKADGTQVLEASATLGPDHGETLLDKTEHTFPFKYDSRTTELLKHLEEWDAQSIESIEGVIVNQDSLLRLGC